MLRFIFLFSIQVHADKQNPDMVFFKCVYENKSEIKELAFYFNSNSPWGYFDNGYYKIVSNAYDFITALKLNGKELQESAFYDALGGEILVLQLSIDLLWVSIIRDFTQPDEIGVRAFSYRAKCKECQKWDID